MSDSNTVPQIPVPAQQPDTNGRRTASPGEQVFTDVSIIVGTQDGLGNRIEQVIDIDPTDVLITKCDISQERKVVKVKNEEGNLIGFEPSGEYELKMHVKYVDRA